MTSHNRDVKISRTSNGLVVHTLERRDGTFEVAVRIPRGDYLYRESNIVAPGPALFVHSEAHKRAERGDFTHLDAARRGTGS